MIIKRIATKLTFISSPQLQRSFKKIPLSYLYSWKQEENYGRYFSPISYSFCNKKEIEKDLQKQLKPETHKKLTKQEERRKYYQQKEKELKVQKQQVFRQLIGLPKDHSFKNELIVSQDTYNKSKRELKQAILFQDMLKNQLDILVYDTNGKPYLHHIIKTILVAICAFGILHSVYFQIKKKPKMKVFFQRSQEGKIIKNFMVAISVLALLRLLHKHVKLSKKYIEKIVYNTQTENFTFTKRKFYGKKYTQEVSRFKILHTQNQALLRRGTNYLNIDNLNQYSIVYGFAWKKEDLFSHLICQRIKK